MVSYNVPEFTASRGKGYYRRRSQRLGHRAVEQGEAHGVRRTLRTLLVLALAIGLLHLVPVEVGAESEQGWRLLEDHQIFEDGEIIHVGWSLTSSHEAGRQYTVSLISSSDDRVQIEKSVRATEGAEVSVELLEYDSSRVPAGEYRVVVRDQLSGSELNGYVHLTSWDWTRYRSLEAWTKDMNEPEPLEPSVSLPPYHDQHGYIHKTMTVDDVHPSNGWVLISKEFGAAGRAVQTQHFVIYNRFSGALRMFWVNESAENFSEHLVTLESAQTGPGLDTLLAFNKEGGVVLDEPSTAASQGHIGRLQSGTWAYADFSILGYDPSLQPNARFVFNIWGIDVSKVDLAGDLDLEQIVEEAEADEGNGTYATVSRVGGSIVGAAGKFAGAVNGFNSSNNAVNKIIEDTGPGGKSAKRPWAKPVNGLLSSFVGGVIPVLATLGPLAALVPIFGALFGGPEERAMQPLKFEGGITLTGTLTTRSDLRTFSIPVPGSPQTRAGKNPSLYSSPPGIYGYASRPKLRVESDFDIYRSSRGGYCRVIHRFWAEEFDAIINPYLGRKVELAIGFASIEGEPVDGLDWENLDDPGFARRAFSPPSEVINDVRETGGHDCVHGDWFDEPSSSRSSDRRSQARELVVRAVVGADPEPPSIFVNVIRPDYHKDRGWVRENFGAKAGGWEVRKHPRLMADVNGDGRADVVGFGESAVWVSLGVDRSSSRRGATFEEPFEAVRNFSVGGQGWEVGRHPRLMADVNGDGRADIVGFGGTAVWVSLGRSDGRFEEASLGTHGYAYDTGWRVDRHPRLMADVNGDGRDDIVGFGDSGVTVSHATSDGTFEQVEDGSFTGYGYDTGWRVDKHPRLMADVNGDGRDDIVGFGDSGMSVSLATSDGTFHHSEGRGNSHHGYEIDAYGYDSGWRVDKHPRLMADVNGDGIADLVAFWDNGIHLEQIYDWDLHKPR